MPTYEYVCETCGHRFDVRQSFSDGPVTSCPECTGGVRRVFHPAGVIFKGSGWYVTDNRKSPASENGSSDVSNGSGSAEVESKSSTAAG